MGREYGQFCGLARAAEVIGERWTLLILRDLSVGPARFGELRAGLPGIVSTMLTTRLRELQAAGIVELDDNGAPRYRLTSRGAELLPALNALSLWGASDMAHPRPTEIVTDRSLAAMLVAARTGAQVDPFTLQVVAGDSAAHADVTATGITAHPGPMPTGRRPDLDLRGAGLREALANPDRIHHIIRRGDLHVDGEPSRLTLFTRTFAVPLRPPRNAQT